MPAKTDKANSAEMIIFMTLSFFEREAVTRFVGRLAARAYAPASTTALCRRAHTPIASKRDFTVCRPALLAPHGAARRDAGKLPALAPTALLDVVENNPKLAVTTICLLCTRLRETDQRLEAIALHRIEVRLARLLPLGAEASGGNRDRQGGASRSWHVAK